MTQLFQRYQSEYARMKQLVEELPKFVSQQHIQEDIIPGTVTATCFFTSVFCFSVWSLSSRKQGDRKSIYETSYLITTCCSNIIVGILGIYYYMFVMEHPGTIDSWILGYKSVYPLSCIQLAKNLFAIPVGLTLTHERTDMIFHHFAVLFVACMAAFLTTGFTYFAPVLYGLIEISSVPLAFMNFFKFNPEYIQAYPKLYSNIRLAFGVSFLFVRWILSVPAMCSMMRLVLYRFIIFVQDGDVAFSIAMWVTFIAVAFLTFLQLYWGWLIVKSVKGTSKQPPSAQKKMD